MISLVIIADDFTGALDTGAQLSKHGMSTAVVSDCEAALPDCEALVCSLDCRHDAPKTAYAKVFSAAARWRGEAVPVYIKTDSALRGNLAASFRAAMDALELPLVFVPAFPRMSRITREGVHYIDGVPLAQSAFADDPRNPMRESFIPAMLPGIDTVLVRESEAAAWQYDPAARKVTLFDCVDEAGMQSLAILLAGQNALMLSAGCAGLAGELHRLPGLRRLGAEAFPAGRGLLVVSGSVNSRSIGQIEAAREAGIKILHISPDMILRQDFTALSQTAAEAAELLRNGETAVLATVRKPEDREALDALAAKRGIAEQELPGLILPRIAELADRALESAPDSVLFVFGGDTTHAILRRIGCGTVTLCGEIEVGVPLSCARIGGRALPLITKSGGLGSRGIIKTAETMLCAKEVFE